ncbi:DgyrCDS1667 [Dimorphilus gyrociliatus]|uniref:DgyrCDS1667 n=1 Tax=Dimorphilus gyrociliatus TaxID=2664684 RepID=A0A7I8V9H1_9ANNE|nr:DgyrCDS1667 [Dimorphilus gyrociliatus]
MIIISESKSIRSAVEMQWNELHRRKRDLNYGRFDASLFSRAQIKTSVPSWAKRIMAKGPLDRADDDCKKLHALLRGLKSFDKFTEPIQLAMCKAFTYFSVDCGRTILRRGHVGQNFYFIFSGSVFVNVEETNSKGQTFYKTEVVLKRGESFGELALLKDIRRTATVTCRESCEMFVVDKEVFAQVCPRIFERELDEKLRFLKSINIFQNKFWSPDKLSSLAFDAQIQQFKTNKVVVKDSWKDEWFYICMTGQCKVIKCLSVHDVRNRRISVREDHGLKGKLKILKTSTISSSEDDDDRDEYFSENEEHRMIDSIEKKRLLAAMEVRYRDLDEEEDTNKSSSNLVLRFREDEIKEESEEEFEEEDRSGIITLNTLMREKKRSNPDRIFVFMHIGNLDSKQAFDIKPLFEKDKDKSSGLILVSNGCKMFRIRKETWKKMMNHESEQLVDHVKSIADNDPYPSERTIISSYLQKCQWESYKRQTVKSALLCSNRFTDIFIRKSANKSNEVINRLRRLSAKSKPDIEPMKKKLNESKERDYVTKWLADSVQLKHKDNEIRIEETITIEDRRRISMIVPKVEKFT